MRVKRGLPPPAFTLRLIRVIYSLERKEAMSNIQDPHENGSSAVTAATEAGSSATCSQGDGTVFISYRRNDGKSYANNLRRLLRAAGLDVWQDTEDLDHGNVTDRVTEAIAGAQAAVLVVTPDICNSTVVRDIELPALLKRAEDPDFCLCIANAVGKKEDSSECDYSAPDRLLEPAWQEKLDNKNQVNLRVPSGAEEIARILLKHRLKQRQAIKNFNKQDFTLHIDTRWTGIRPAPQGEDLHILLEPSEGSRLLSTESMELFRRTLPLISSTVQSSRARGIRISGHAHLSVGLALGAALPETLVNVLNVEHRDGQTWSSFPSQENSDTAPITVRSSPQAQPEPDETPRIAVFVDLLGSADEEAFNSLTHNSVRRFHTVGSITWAGDRLIDPHEAAYLSRYIATQIKKLARSIKRAPQAEVHLAYAGPLPMAVLIGGFLNTLTTVVYEYDQNAYTPVFSLNPSQKGGPITAIY